MAMSQSTSQLPVVRGTVATPSHSGSRGTSVSRITRATAATRPTRVTTVAIARSIRPLRVSSTPKTVFIAIRTPSTTLDAA